MRGTRCCALRLDRGGRRGGNDGATGRPTLLERVFELAQHGSEVRTEAIAGLTTFLTMVYIVFVNPAILGNAGMDKGAVFTAT
jgi:adenine/guanine/hypoxanthine permease